MLVFLQIYVQISFVNSCSYLLGVGTTQINNLNVSTISNLGNLNVFRRNTSLITNLSCIVINSGLNKKLEIIDIN